MSFDITELVKSVPNRDTSREQIEYIPLEKLLPDADNFYSMTGIEELAANIETAGLQQPLRVYINQESPDCYTILSGHRRNSALQLLANDDPEKWGTVPCIVERDNVPIEARKLRLLLANRDTRKLTSADLDRQAADMEKYIVALKDQGYRFPGRLSDYVAQCLGSSKTKLNRLKIIREGLIPEWKEMWADGKINDSVAYNMAHLDKQEQNTYARFYRDKPQNLPAWAVDEKLNRFDALPKDCKKCGGSCRHRGEMKMILIDPNENHNCSGCCLDCYYLETCKRSCPEADEKKEQKKQEKKDRKSEEKFSQQIREAPILEYLTQAFSRVYGLMKEKGLSVADMLTCDGKNTYGTKKNSWNISRAKKSRFPATFPLAGALDMRTATASSARRSCWGSALIICSPARMRRRPPAGRPGSRRRTGGTSSFTGSPGKRRTSMVRRIIRKKMGGSCLGIQSPLTIIKFLPGVGCRERRS